MEGPMTESSNGTQAEISENASVAQAGEPQGLDQQGAPQAESPQGEDGTPTPEELDARNEAFSGPRKPMGPVESVNPESVPEEPEEA
jgi:hypothetical protein